MKTLLFPHSFKKIGWTLFPFILIIDIINAIMMHTKLFEQSSGMMHQMYEFLNNRSELFTNIAIKIVATICAEEMPYIMHDETSYFAPIIWMLYYGRFEQKVKNLRRQSRQFNL